MMPKSSWGWGDKYDRYVVDLDPDHGRLIWSWFGPKDLGGSTDQTVADFLAFGPLDRDAPESVLIELCEAIRARDVVGWLRMLAEAEAARADRLQQKAAAKRASEEEERAAYARYQEIKSWPDPWCRYVGDPKKPDKD